MLTKEEILDYLREIKPELEKDGITKIGLFGSYAKDKASIYSDIDITIETTDKFVKNFTGFKALIYLDDLRNKIARHFKTPTDLCDSAGFKDDVKRQKVLKGVIYV